MLNVVKHLAWAVRLTNPNGPGETLHYVTFRAKAKFLYGESVVEWQRVG
jgi:hypothetical protein